LVILQALQETLRVSTLRILLFLSGCCLKTEVFKQLYCHISGITGTFMTDKYASIKLQNIYKKYPGVTALKGINMTVYKGEILSLLGENGAGKSTLVKILSGAIPAGEYKGDFILNGQPVHFSGTRMAAENGIVMIPQEISLQLDLSVAENIMLGNWPRKAGIFVNWEQLYGKASEILKKLALDLDLTMPARNLSSSLQQMVCIAKALVKNPAVLVLDEPTSALTKKETAILLDRVRTLRDSGISCIYISHKMDEVFQISDRVIVFRDGELISEYTHEQIVPSKIMEDILGYKRTEEFQKQNFATNQVVLRLKNVTVPHMFFPGKPLLSNVSFDLYKGEILGLAGLLGSGRSELLKTLFGELSKISGDIYIGGKKQQINNTTDAINYQIGLLTESRSIDGFIPTMSVGQNMSITIIYKLIKWFLLNRRREKELIAQYFNALSIRAPSQETPILSLSGGNQQKVLVAKWLMNESKILLLDEPTRGIDIGAKEEIYRLMSNLAKQGTSIIMVSSELSELVQMCDRFVVLSNGEVKNILSKKEVSEKVLMEMITNVA
jgi:ABC-type sugar transport system ATPase subunit